MLKPVRNLEYNLALFCDHCYRLTDKQCIIQFQHVVRNILCRSWGEGGGESCIQKSEHVLKGGEGVYESLVMPAYGTYRTGLPYWLALPQFMYKIQSITIPYIQIHK